MLARKRQYGHVGIIHSRIAVKYRLDPIEYVGAQVSRAKCGIQSILAA